jgi:hypothetical protein
MATLKKLVRYEDVRPQMGLSFGAGLTFRHNLTVANTLAKFWRIS